MVTIIAPLNRRVECRLVKERAPLHWPTESLWSLGDQCDPG